MHDGSLTFLDDVLGSRRDFYKTSTFLESDFGSDVWVIAVSSAKKNGKASKVTVDFKKELSDGSLLTDQKNRPLLNMFKYWINASTHPDNVNGLRYASNTAYHLIIKVLSVIDYFLLNDKHFKLHLCGLEAVTVDDFKVLANRTYTNKKAAEGIYDWSNRLSNLLTDKINSFGEEKLNQIIIESKVGFQEMTDSQVDNNRLSIPLEKIPYARAWLWSEGFYLKGKKGQPYLFAPNTIKLSKELYGKNTLWGDKGSKPYPEILCIGSKESNKREYPAASTSSHTEDSVSISTGRGYQKSIKAINLLNDRELLRDNLPLPIVESVDGFLSFSTDNLTTGRYRTVPSKVIFKSVREAIKFHIKYAEQIVSSLDSILHLYSERLRRKTDEQSNKIQELLTQKEFLRCLHPKIRQLGVERWGVEHKKEKTVRAKLLRQNKAFANLVRVYYGGAAIVIGALMARRQAEIDSLYADNCLDTTESFLLFKKAKSTKLLGGHRTEVARPIDEMGVEMIKVLVDIQKLYLKHGFIEKTGKLFDTLSVQQAHKFLLIDNYHQLTHESIDMFCDYIEAPLNNHMQRYYLRQHQLRRFFALSFFWGSGFGGMDTLRWFLGHVDAQHLYHYITETSPGAVLVHAKAQFLAETIEEHKELKELLFKRYGTNDFTILESDELEGYINELLDSGEVEMEPDFFEDDDGNKYELIVTVRGRSDG